MKRRDLRITNWKDENGYIAKQIFFALYGV